jgi:hypothetical protein
MLHPLDLLVQLVQRHWMQPPWAQWGLLVPQQMRQPQLVQLVQLALLRSMQHP